MAHSPRLTDEIARALLVAPGDIRGREYRIALTLVEKVSTDAIVEEARRRGCRVIHVPEPEPERVGTSIRSGTCGSRREHRPHTHTSEKHGTFWCTGHDPQGRFA